MSNTNQIEALIHLIDDPDEDIFMHVRDRLMQYGPDAIPFLENSWGEKDYGLIFLNRIELLIHDIQFSDTKKQLLNWISGDKDLLSGALVVAKYQYPSLDDNAIRSFFIEMRKKAWLEMNPRMTAFEKVHTLNKIFYETYRFKGDSKNFHSPSNSYLNIVTETRKGNPLSLSIIYSIVAQTLEMPVYGVNLPNHFVLAYMDEDGTNAYFNSDNRSGVLFYINAFSQGGIFDEEEITAFVKKLNIPMSREYLEPCSNSMIIRRMLTNLISGFQQAGNAEKVQELTELRELLD